MSPRWPNERWLRPRPYLMNTRRLRPPGSWQVTISFANVLMNGGGFRLRTLTRCPSRLASERPRVSHSSRVAKSGNSDCGVFMGSFFTGSVSDSRMNRNERLAYAREGPVCLGFNGLSCDPQPSFGL